MASSRNPPSAREPLETLVARAVKAHLRAGDAITVGFSGGRDSVVLLDCLHRLGLAPRAVHVHHGLSPNADAWAAFCARFAARRRIALAIERVTIAPGRGLEAAARAARYAVFARSPGGLMALAHHADDQAETVLLQLVRGAGAAGLAAMPECRALAPGLRLLRPLLAVPRAEIERYARKHRLRWVDDESNEDTARARNYLRHEVLPRLAPLNPAAVMNIGRSARHLGEVQGLVEALGRHDLVAASAAEGVRIEALRALDPARRRNALRTLFRDRAIEPPSEVRLDSIWRQLAHARADARIAIEQGGAVVRRFRGCLVLEVDSQPTVPATVRWNGERPWVLPEFGGRLRLAHASGRGIATEFIAPGRVEVRARSGGERLRLQPGAPSRSLKNLFQERAVPPWERERRPLLFIDGTLAWVPGVGIASVFCAASGMPGTVPIWEGPTKVVLK